MSTTQSEDDTKGFTYEQLPDAGKYIRLLTILDFDEKTRPIPVHCRLTTWPISEAPEYHAVSYVWGDANHTATILINGKTLQVTQNCEYTLRQATCNEEKGPQVSLMGQVYSDAERVLACVGKCNRTSRYLYRQVRREPVFSGEQRFVYEYSPLPGLGFYSRRPASTWKRLRLEFEAFLGRPYFSRVWIYQELFLGRQVSVCCGKQHMSVYLLHGLAETVQSWLRWSYGRAGVIGPKKRLPYKAMSPLSAGASDPEPAGLFPALVSVRRLECTDPRDRIYGILSTIDRSENMTVVPDYTKDRLEVAVEVLRIVSSGASWGDGQFYVWHFIVQQVSGSLNLLNDPSPQLEEETRRRRRLDPSKQSSVNLSPEHRRHGICVGWRLAYEDGGWKFEGGVVTSPFHQDLHLPISVQSLSEFVKTRETGTYGVLLPPVTRPGDWCLFYSRALSPAFIARPRADGHFDIVGKALPEVCRDYFEGPSEFEVHFDDEDSIVYLCTHYAARALGEPFRGPLHDELNEFIETRACGQPGSSYAVMRKPGGRDDSWEDVRRLERNMPFG